MTTTERGEHMAPVMNGLLLDETSLELTIRESEEPVIVLFGDT